MHIGIDFSSVIYGRGVSRYTQNLAAALARLPNITLSLYGYSLRQKAVLESAARTIPSAQTSFHSFPTSLMQLLWRFGFKKVSSDLPNLDIFHSWDWMQPPDKSIPIVSTIHDLAIIKFPETAHPNILKAHKASWEALKAHKSHIIAVSRATKRDIIELLDYPPYMVHVVHEALPQEFLATADSVTEEQEESIKRKLKLEKPYLFFVGTREPRKNLDRLIQAWQPLADKYELIIAGDAGWDETDQAAKKYKHQPRFLGRVSDEALSVLYANAEVFVFPSLYEGFGLPILESFHHTTPVVTSDNSGMVEVAGNAAELVDPESVESIRAGIQTILDEDQTAQSKRIQRMIIRQQMFNWETTAKETVKVYKQALADHE